MDKSLIPRVEVGRWLFFRTVCWNKGTPVETKKWYRGGFEFHRARQWPTWFIKIGYPHDEFHAYPIFRFPWIQVELWMDGCRKWSLR